MTDTSDEYIDVPEADTIIPDHILFEQRRKPRPQGPSDVNSIGIPDRNNTPFYAITVNIQPTKKMNNKQWKKYSHDAQIKQLIRIESSLRKKNPSIQLHELHFEECPSLGNMHYHALYSMPMEMIYVYTSYFDRVCGSDGEQTDPWRLLCIKPVKTAEQFNGWLDYIRKGLTK